MSRRAVAVLLALGAIAAAAINLVYWTAPPAAGGPGDDASFESASEGDLPPLPPLSWDRVTAYVASLPDPETRRSPFHTRDEALALASARPDPDAVAGAEAPGASLRLDGTLYGPERRVAWLDGRPHSEGDPVGGFRVVSIARGAVTLTREEEVLEIAVGESAPTGAAPPVESETVHAP